jgi:serine/threonine-protein kinase SRPK3
MMELLGKMPRKVALHGKYAKDYFNRNAELRNIKKLKFWPLDRVLVEKYEVPREEVRDAVLAY